MALLFNTSLYTFQTPNKNYSAVGSTIYDAVWGVISWYDNEPILNIEKIEKNKTILDDSIVKGINETIKEIPKGFRNLRGFSCFIDSILFPLLTIDGYFKRHFLNDIPQCINNKETIQLPELLQAMKNSSKFDTCEPFIKILKQCDIMKEILNDKQQDDSEFFLKLMEIYKLKPTTVSELQYLSPDDSNFFENYNNTEPFSVLKIDIDSDSGSYSDTLIDMFQTPDRTELDESNLAIYEKIGEKMKYKYNIKKIIDSDALVFYIKRMVSLNKKDRRKVLITKMLKKGDKLYELVVVTVHRGASIHSGHYVSYFKWDENNNSYSNSNSNSNYFLYDDVSNVLEITDWPDLLENASRDCSLLIYYPV